MIIKTRFIPKSSDAFTIWPFIFIRSEKADDQNLIELEKVHYKEQRNCLVLPWLVGYHFSKNFQLAAKVRAYRHQVELKNLSLGKAAYRLTKYNFGISFIEALRKLRKK